ncbi:MAG: type phosphodiesterase/nucleotide pyrophosphatase [Thermoleophilia bacterium]|nr:type phosphodiesterase/nucleotide pyrophosphatase [Thermoleophilia bacterium]
MQPIHGPHLTEPHAAPARRRRRTLPGAAVVAGPAIAAGFGPALGYDQAPLPPGSRRLGPIHVGDQGVSPKERPHAEQAITRLFEAAGVDMIGLYDTERGTYELRSRTGLLRWERWATPSGDLRYRIVEQRGENPVPNVDGTLLRTLEEEVAAAGGVGRPVPKDRNSFPDPLARIAQLFDHERAPEFVYIPTTGGDPNHPGAGSHGIPDMVQSRAPVIISGPGIARGAVADLLVRHEDIAPTIADLVGVRPIDGTNASGVRRMQLMKWQDGRSIAGALRDARSGSDLHGAAQRAIMFTIDGLSQPVLLDEVKRGLLPNIARVMSEGTILRNGTLAEYPTVTWANHNTLVTGAAPGHNGLVNNSWFDRATQTERLITDGGFRNTLRTGRLMDPQVETLYEAVERSFPNAQTVAINQPSGRGADISILDLEGIPKLLTRLPRLATSMVREMIRGPREYDKASKEDAFALAAGETLWSGRTPPKLGVLEFTLVDTQGHKLGPQTDDARRALRLIDRQIGQVLAGLDRSGLRDSTAIVVTADHGQEHQDLDEGKLGGWFQALDRAALDGAKTKESTRFVYVKSVQASVASAVPAAGTTGELAIDVRNDDLDAEGARPPVAGATVTIRDAAGGTWSAVTGADGRVRIPISPTAGPLAVQVEHVDFSRELLTVALPGAADAATAAAARRRRR